MKTKTADIIKFAKYWRPALSISSFKKLQQGPLDKSTFTTGPKSRQWVMSN